MKNENGQEKNAILKGQTLVNAIKNTTQNGYGTLSSNIRILENGWISANGTNSNNHFELKMDNLNLKTSTTYMYIIECRKNTFTGNGATFQFGDTYSAVVNTPWTSSHTIKELPIGIYTFKLTTKEDFSSLTNPVGDRSYLCVGSGEIEFRYMIIEYQDGMENWNIPFFEGMQSVTMPSLMTSGKNMFDGKLIVGNIQSADGAAYELPHMRITDFVKVNANKTITLSKLNNNDIEFRIDKVAYYDTNKNFMGIHGELFAFPKTLTPPKGAAYIRAAFCKGRWDETVTEEDFKTLQVQIEEGSTATPYEPFKSNILTTNEEVTLRGIGNVRDTLNLETGELTERIGEIVLDGSNDEDWIMNNEDGYTNKRFRTQCLKNKILYNDGTVCNIICDKVPCYSNSTWRDDREGIEHDNIYISFRKNCENITEFKQWLSQNPITIKYALVIPTTKTVDLSIVDQDNQPQDRMKIYPSGYINTSSSTFPPILELKGIVHNNKLNMTTTNGVYTNNVQSLTNPILDGIVCKDGTVVRDSYDVESGLYTKRVFRFTVDEGFIERYRSNFINNASDNNMYELRIDVSQINIPNSKDVVRGISTNMNYNTSISTIKVQNGRVYIRIPKEEVSSYDVNGLLEWIKRNGAIEVAYEMATPQIIHMQPNMTPYVSTRPYQGEINSQGNALESSFLDYAQEESILSPKPLGEGDVLRWEQGSQCYVYENDKDYIPLTDYNQKVGTVLDLEEEDGEQFVENLDGGEIVVDVPFKEKAVYERELISYEDTVIYPTIDKLDPDGKVEVDYICGATWQNPNDLSDIQHLGTLREDGQYDVTIRRSGDDEIRLMDGTTHIGLDGDGLNPSEFELTYFNNGGVEVGKYGDTSHTLEDCVLDSKLETGTIYGNTLVNLMTNCKDEYVVRYYAANNPNNNVANISMMKPNTEYTLFYKAKYRTEGDGSGIGGSLKIATSIEQGFITTGQSYTTEYMKYVYRFTTSSVVDCFVFSSTDKYFAIKECVLLEGDYTNYPMDIPYFKGVNSTVVNGFNTTGKNLLDSELFIPTHNANIDLTMDGEGWIEANCKAPQTTHYYHVDLTKLPKGEYKVVAEYYEGFDKYCGCQLRRYDGKYDYGINIKIDTEIHYQVDLYMQTTQDVPTRRVKLRPMLVPYSETDLTYEPYHSIQHTLPSPITLNKVGNVADTYDVVGGVETRNYVSAKFDGSEDENWVVRHDNYGTAKNRIYGIFVDGNMYQSGNNTYTDLFITNYKYSSVFSNSFVQTEEGLWGVFLVGNEQEVRLITPTGTTTEQLKEYLQANPLEIVVNAKTPQKIQHTLIPSTVEMMQEPTFILPQPLRSVPNGICDRLYWDENKGHYCIEKRIERFTIDGSYSNIAHGGYSNSNYIEIYMNGIIKSVVDNQGYCEDPSYTMNGYNGNAYINSANYKAFSIGVNKASLIVPKVEIEQVIGTTYNRDFKQLKQYLALKPVTILYPLATSEIIDLPHLNKKLTLPTHPNTLPIGYKVEYPKANPQIGLTIPYKQLNPPSQPQNLDFQMNKEDYVLTWNDVKEARQYNVILNDNIVATTKVPWYNTGEEIHGYILVEAQNEIADNLSKELYVKTVPKAPAQLTVAHNGLTDNYDFEISFIKSTSSLADRYTVQYRVDGGEWIIQDIPADEVDANVKVLWKFSVFEIKNQIEVWATATNDMGTNDILPLSTYYMTPTPQWTYRINSREVFLRWVDESPYDTQYKLRYQYKSDGIYRYAHFEGDKEEIGQLYEAVVALAEDDEVTLELCVISDRENLYCKPIKASKALDPNILPPKNFNYRWLSRGLIEFYWEDVYDVDLEYEAIVEHRLSGETTWIEDRRVFSATDTEGTGTVYRLQYQMEDLEEIRVKVRMKWAMNETEWSESLTTVFIPVEGNPPQWIRRTQTQEGLLVEWEAQEYIDSYHVYVKGDGVELQHLETKDNFIYVDIDYSNPIDIEIYEVSRFTGGIEAEPSDSMRFIPHQNKQQMINNIYHPDSLKYEIEVDTVQKAQKASYQINDINTTPDVRTREAMDVSISSPFIITYHPLEVDVHQKGVKSYGVAETHIKTLDVKTRETVEVLTFERITDKYDMDFTVYTPSVSKYPVNLEINQVRIVCLGDSLTSGHPLYWAESGTGDVTASYPYQLAKRLKNQYEVINKGYGSDTTDRCLARFDKDVLAYNPQYCLYQCGTNDKVYVVVKSFELLGTP